MDFLKTELRTKCHKWIYNYSLYKLSTFLIPTTITVVNFLSTIIFVKLSKFENQNNTGMENLLVFQYVLIQSSINTGIVLYLYETSTFSDNWYLTMGP